MRHIKIFDTTLRDGEQSPGASMTGEEKLRIAKALEKLRVDIIEAGFPSASPGDADAVSKIAHHITESTVCALARAIKQDIECAAHALQKARSKRIHTFIATSKIHMEKKLAMDETQVLERAVAAVKLARNFTDDVEFSPEDAARSEKDFLCKVIEQAIKAGANTINIPDTVGYAIPEQFGALIAYLIKNIPNSDKAVFSAHCHNDLGLATANALIAIKNGAGQIECTINGLGERAGNTALEEVVMAIKTRKDYFDCETFIKTTQIMQVSRLVSSITSFAVQPNKAIVGINAFAHEAGIHQDGILKHRETYEIMQAQDVGLQQNRLVLGKHSGKHALKKRFEEMDVVLSEEKLQKVFEQFKILADKKHEIFTEDLQALISECNQDQPNPIKLVHLETKSQTGEVPTVHLCIEFHGQMKTYVAQGDGQIDACFKAINAMTKTRARLEVFSVNNITSGTDAQGEVSVRIEEEGRIVTGHGTDTDIIFAAVKSYIHALNQLMLREVHKKHPQL